MADETQLIAKDQVRIGMFIKLDLSWFQHSFPMSSFKITNEQQIKELQALKLKHVRYIPSKTDPVSVQVNAKSSNAGMAAPIAASAQVFENILEAKRTRFEKLKQQREEIARCEEKFVHAATVVKNIDKMIFARPEETIKEAGKLVDSIAEVFMSGNDAVMHLIQHTVGGEEIYFHSLNVSVPAMMLANEMKCTEAQIKSVGMAGLFHDLGKVNVPDNIVKKTTAFTKAEQNFLEMHP